MRRTKRQQPPRKDDKRSTLRLRYLLVIRILSAMPGGCNRLGGSTSHKFSSASIGLYCPGTNLYKHFTKFGKTTVVVPIDMLV